MLAAYASFLFVCLFAFCLLGIAVKCTFCVRTRSGWLGRDGGAFFLLSVLLDEGPAGPPPASRSPGLPACKLDSSEPILAERESVCRETLARSVRNKPVSRVSICKPRGRFQGKPSQGKMSGCGEMHRVVCLEGRCVQNPLIPLPETILGCNWTHVQRYGEPDNHQRNIHNTEGRRESKISILGD